MNDLFQEIVLPVHGSDDGFLIAMEEQSDFVPFTIKRIYYIYNVKHSLRRGFHAHKNLKQVMVCVRGKCDLMLDDGKERVNIELNSPSRAILIDKPLWREMYNFSSDCVLLVLASEFYDTQDYIWDYKDFLKFIGSSDV